MIRVNDELQLKFDDIIWLRTKLELLTPKFF
jgi:hypothetical protein